MPVDSSAAYIPLDGSSRSGCWGQRSTLERSLIFIIAFLAIITITLTIVLVDKKCHEPPVTTVAPNVTTTPLPTTQPSNGTTNGTTPHPSTHSPTVTTTPYSNGTTPHPTTHSSNETTPHSNNTAANTSLHPKAKPLQ